jgi:hypothetical protein
MKRSKIPLSPHVVEEVSHALATQPSLDRTALARRLGISDRTIRRIAAGEHVIQQSASRSKRCGKCGHKVILPCRICSTRAAIAAA